MGGKRVIKWAAVLATAMMVCAVALSVFAPQVFVLVREGFPPSQMPSKGEFLEVKGGNVEWPIGNPPSDQAVKRLLESDGTALLFLKPDGSFGEVYTEGTDREVSLNSYSLVKSLVGLLVLMAIDEGRIDSLDVALPELVPNAPDILLYEALTMTAGLSLKGEPPKQDVDKPLDDAQFSAFGPVARLHAFGIEAILPRLLIDPDLRGSFHYQSANTALLGAVVENVYGARIEKVLSDKIWKPSGASTAYWRANPATGRASVYCCLYARPLDWLMVGRFLMQNGGEAPLLSDKTWQAWVAPNLARADRRRGTYGLHIRHNVLDRDGESVAGPFAYMAGHGGQMVYFLPEQETVVVRFGDKPQLLHSTLYDLF